MDRVAEGPAAERRYWRVRFNSDRQGYSADYGNKLGYDTFANGGSQDGMPFQANVGVAPYAVLILSQDNP